MSQCLYLAIALVLAALLGTDLITGAQDGPIERQLPAPISLEDKTSKKPSENSATATAAEAQPRLLYDMYGDTYAPGHLPALPVSSHPQDRLQVDTTRKLSKWLINNVNSSSTVFTLACATLIIDIVEHSATFEPVLQRIGEQFNLSGNASSPSVWVKQSLVYLNKLAQTGTFPKALCEYLITAYNRHLFDRPPAKPSKARPGDKYTVVEPKEDSGDSQNIVESRSVQNNNQIQQVNYQQHHNLSESEKNRLKMKYNRIAVAFVKALVALCLAILALVLMLLLSLITRRLRLLVSPNRSSLLLPRCFVRYRPQREQIAIERFG